ncbi:MAG: hypothetical protein P4L40_21645 [Terracidiphilus sp.]|nr:hypothetical protein [Terracidiphilus sp.]
MRPISAADAIAPAVLRMRDLLFRPFVFTTFLKLSFIAVLTEGYSGNFNSSWRNKADSGSSMPSVPHIAWTPDLIALIVGIIVGALLLGLLIAYVVIRLRFALFHCLVHGTTEIKPGWRLYRDQAGRYFWLSIVVGIVFFAVIAVISVPFVFGFVRFAQASQNNHFDVPSFLAVFLPLIPVILLIVVVAIAIAIFLRDLMLPHMALDNASAGQAWQAARETVLREKGAFLLYALLRILLPMAVVMGVAFALIIPGAIVAFPLMAMAQVTPALAIGFGVLAVIAAVAVALGVGGPLSISVRYYALVFYGSRYGKLGQLLWPAPPAPEPAALPAE